MVRVGYPCPTELSELNSNLHGRERRQERGIEKIELQTARRYGMKEQAKFGRIKYTYGGIVFIYDPIRRTEITSYRSSDTALESSGTKVARPVILPKRETHDKDEILHWYERKRSKIVSDPSKWTSHSVLVVDMSGSMRRDDVNGGKCRSDGVWMTLARDYIKKPLDNKTRTNDDILSVIVMKDNATVVLKHELISYVLYNKLIDLREWSNLRPSGPGNYLPALDKAEELLMANQHGSCSLSLMFFSDGRPSDHADFSQRMGKIASRFGRRLSVACIGMAEAGEDFSTLSNMVSEAESYGAMASFGKPSLDADSLSNIITTLATSLTSSKTELTDLAKGKVRKVKMDIMRERKDTPDDLYLTNDWTTYRSDQADFIQNIWTWNDKKDVFQLITDTRCRSCWDITSRLCSNCSMCRFCDSCIRQNTLPYMNHGIFCQKFKIARLSGVFADKSVPSWNVALKNTVFGEGAERIVRKFRYLTKDNEFVGPVMVAKESRFTDGDEVYDKKMDYHKNFMCSQSMASRLAKEFNAAIKNLPNQFQQHETVKKAIDNFPSIEFLEPLVIQAQHHIDGEINILIEQFLEGKYEKFNDNMGMVKGHNAKVNMDEITNGFGQMGINEDDNGLGIIEEGSEDEDEDEIFDNKETRPESGSYNLEGIKAESFPQAFSHFTFEKSRKSFIVVDLQGVLETKPNGRRVYRLTDPAIHQKNRKSQSNRRNWNFGRTDRGYKGIRAFFHSHRCNEVCRLLGLEDQGDRIDI